MRSERGRYIAASVLVNTQKRIVRINSIADHSSITTSVKSTKMRLNSSLLELHHMTDMEVRSSYMTRATADIPMTILEMEDTTEETPSRKDMTMRYKDIVEMEAIIAAISHMGLINRKGIQIGARKDKTTVIFNLEVETLIAIIITAINRKRQEMDTRKIAIIIGPTWTIDI